MLTRRGFAGFASCAICAVTGFVATDASAAEGALPGVTPASPGKKRYPVIAGGELRACQ